MSRDAGQHPVPYPNDESQQAYVDKLYAKGLRTTSQATDIKGGSVMGSNYAIRDQRNSTMANSNNERSALGLQVNPNPNSSSFSPSKRQITN